MPLALLEHINFNILDSEAAHRFYVTGLGGKVNETSTNERQLHVNLGASQFHLLLQYNGEEGPKPVEAAQRWAGHVELWSREPMPILAERLASIGSEPDLQTDANGNSLVRVHCPWGNLFVVRQAPSGFDPQLHGGHPSGSAHLIALTRAVHHVRPGAAAPLHAFWSGTLGARCDLATAPKRDTEAHPPLAHCIVRFGSGQQLIFDEREDAPAATAYETDEARAYHIAVYMDHLDGFREAFCRCEAAGLLYANPVFAASPPEFGNAMAWDEVAACGQFRIKDLGRRAAAATTDDGVELTSASGGGSSSVDVSDADGVQGSAPKVAALVLEVEIRSVAHRSCPMTRADIVAGGGAVDTPAALANWPPLQPPPHAKPGVIRIPHGRGGFGAAAREIAAEKRGTSPARGKPSSAAAAGGSKSRAPAVPPPGAGKKRKP